MAILQRFAHDVRLAFRRLRRIPGFTITVVLTLALGIGATTAIFSLVEGILLRPLPFANPRSLVLVGDHLGSSDGTNITAREIATYSEANTAFSSSGGYTEASYEISGGPTPEEVNAGRLSASVFPALDVAPFLGRVFTGQEDTAHQPVAVLSYGLWLTRYHGDSRVLGSTVSLDRRPYTIIGVMPRSFAFPLTTGRLDQAQLWVPLSLTPEELSDQNAGYWGYHLVARLKSGVTPAQGARDADRVAQQIMHNFPASMSTLHIRGDVTPLQEYAVAEARPVLATLFASVLVVLLIACVNVAGLMLVRAIRHRREYAVRLALGARSSAIVRESACEGLLLSVAGGLLGLALAAAGVRVALHLLPESMPRIDSIAMDTGVVTFCLLLAIATGLLCSLIPAFAALRTNVTDSLKEGAPSGTATVSHAWLRSALVVSEIAIALMLLTVAGGLLRSFHKMLAVDPGFRPDHVLVAAYQLPLHQYPTHTAADRFHQAVIERLANKPGVVAAGVTTVLPATGFNAAATYTIEGVPASRWKQQFARFACTEGDFFRAMSIPLLEGRTFTAQDGPGKPLVVIVNQSMAKHSWPGQEAIGKRMHVGNPHKQYPWLTVVGVVADTKPGSRDEPAADQWYTPLQQPASLNGMDVADTLTGSIGGYITLRSALPPQQMVSLLQSTVAEIDPLLALEQVQPMNEVLANVEAPRRFNTSLITGFAAGALLLALIGMYAVVAFSVSLRSQEIAIRMALGAQRPRIVRLVLLAAAKMAAIGCVLGVVVSLAISRLVSGFLFAVSATDPLVYAGAVITMLLLALLASALPALRAASADPIDGLRSS